MSGCLQTGCYSAEAEAVIESILKKMSYDSLIQQKIGLDGELILEDFECSNVLDSFLVEAFRRIEFKRDVFSFSEVEYTMLHILKRDALENLDVDQDIVMRLIGKPVDPFLCSMIASVCDRLVPNMQSIEKSMLMRKSFSIKEIEDVKLGFEKILKIWRNNRETNK